MLYTLLGIGAIIHAAAPLAGREKPEDMLNVSRVAERYLMYSLISFHEERRRRCREYTKAGRKSRDQANRGNELGRHFEEFGSTESTLFKHYSNGRWSEYAQLNLGSIELTLFQKIGIQSRARALLHPAQT